MVERSDVGGVSAAGRAPPGNRGSEEFGGGALERAFALRQIVAGVNRVDRTDGKAKAAIDTLLGLDIIIRPPS
jgi:hypothetical protein